MAFGFGKKKSDVVALDDTLETVNLPELYSKIAKLKGSAEATEAFSAFAGDPRFTASTGIPFNLSESKRYEREAKAMRDEASQLEKLYNRAMKYQREKSM